MGQGFDTLIKKDADTADTLALIISTARDYSRSRFVRECVNKLCTGKSKYDCIRNVFDFYCRNVEYLLDEKIWSDEHGKYVGKEKVYTPARTIAEGKGDCKKASTFIASVLIAAGIEPVFKHVYYQNNDNYTHIYIIIPNPDLSKYITLDPTNKCKFNSEVNYHSATLYFVNGKKMELHQMGAPQYTGQVKWSNDIATGCNAMMNDLDQISLKVMGANNNSAENSRAAFLDLVQKNVNNLAGDLLQLWNHSPEQVEALWKRFGGDPSTLKTILIQSTKTNLVRGPEYIGDFWATLGDVLNKATPVLNSVSNIATTVAPDSSFAKNLQVTATKANEAAPSSTTSVKTPATQGSLLSVAGFVFKGSLLVNLMGFTSTTVAIIQTAIVTGSLLFIAIKHVRK